MAEDEAKEAVPACVIMPTGPSVPALTQLVSELRRVMAPNTPEKLKQRKDLRDQFFLHKDTPGEDVEQQGVAGQPEDVV